MARRRRSKEQRAVGDVATSQRRRAKSGGQRRNVAEQREAAYVDFVKTDRKPKEVATSAPGGRLLLQNGECKKKGLVSKGRGGMVCCASVH